jgi:hypothetical protein
MTFVGAGLDLIQENVSRPAVARRCVQVEQALRRLLDLQQQVDVVTPGHGQHHFSHTLCESFGAPGRCCFLGLIRPFYFSHSLCEKLRYGVCLVKLPHSPKVGGRKSGCTRERTLQITREPIDHAITPTQRCLLLPNRGSDVPVQAHEFSVDGARRRSSCSADTGGQLADESGVVEGDGSLAVHGFNFTTRT